MPAGPDDATWYTDAIVYELHVKAFQDGDGDGVGDLRGLTARLDYLRDLGVTCLWLLPFYPSPLRDDGYDITDHMAVSPRHGTMADFDVFLAEAHRRGLRVIGDLVVNHTSDQHPWFQEARRDPSSPLRNYYVWSRDNRRYAEARVIFRDTEQSNWTWDSVAGAYYWHRFFSHQPDLNYDNPDVQRATMDAMRFWFDRGLDGFRCDAAPYLFEREGTSCESLPETHAFFRRLRAEVDRAYPGRVLLAEANQWPEAMRPYFGDGDEFHMALHFPLMPRLFLALHQEDPRLITDVLARTPRLPDGCQWGLFLRNHDELTLEMCTEAERDQMLGAYAPDPRMRLNTGIRRRLAPLVDNDRRRLELLNGLLFSLPGCPIVYYGDEIGMGDDIRLGDRDGVRTPMQWSAGPNAGFSPAAPERLYSPPIADPVFGHRAVNVEAQARSAASLLSWMRRLIAARRGTAVFARGTLRVLDAGNPHVLAYLREHRGEVVLVVASLAGSAQVGAIDLSPWAGAEPVDLLDGGRRPLVGAGPYRLALAPYGFCWLRLARGEPGLAPLPLARGAQVTGTARRARAVARRRDRPGR